MVERTLVAGLMAWSALALAEGSDADALFAKGRAMLSSGRIAEACVLFERSYGLEPALGTLLNVADCAERQGQFGHAYRAFLESARWALRTGERKREEVARDRLQRIKERVALLSVDVRGRHATATIVRPASNQVEVEFVVVPFEAIALDPGSYLLRVTATDCEPFESRIELTKPGDVRVLAELKPIAPPTAPPVVPPSQPRPATATVVGVTSGVVSVVALVGIIFAETVFARADRQNTGGPDALQPTVTRREFEFASTAFYVSLGVGGAGLLGVVASLIWGLLPGRDGVARSPGARQGLVQALF